MPSKKDLMRVYLDNSTIEPWFEAILIEGKHMKTPGFIQFLIVHKEIEKFISSFTVAELVEKLMFHTEKVRPFMKKLELIEGFVNTFQQTIPNLTIIEEEQAPNGQRGLFISVPELIQFTAKIGDIKDAIHVCIAKHEDLYLVTKDDNIGRVQDIYQRTVGMVGFMKAFE
ncbi:MAG: hypothetical protein HY514_04075 [Candidatus Aenigmarchaeota archaeon]|nr:hypothetical protein [Candidatus Aenigmarchaeota archaeon]